MTGAEIATKEATPSAQGWSPEMSVKLEYARALAVSNLLPTQYRGNPGNLLYAIEFAAGLQIPTINAITSIHVIEGKPSPSADLMIALARRAGHKVRIETGDQQCTVTVIRNDDPDFEFTVTWTMKDAAAAGLANKGTWKSYPRAMLRNRAAAEAIRQACSEVLSGMVHTPDELGWDGDEKPARTSTSRVSSLNDRMTATVSPVIEDAEIADPEDLFGPDDA